MQTRCYQKVGSKGLGHQTWEELSDFRPGATRQVFVARCLGAFEQVILDYITEAGDREKYERFKNCQKTLS